MLQNMSDIKISISTEASFATRARIALYRTKAAKMRDRAALAHPNIVRSTLINVAETYEHMASAVEEIQSLRLRSDPPDQS